MYVSSSNVDAICNAGNLMGISLSFKACPFWMASEISWEVQKYLPVARAASLILLDTTFWGSSHSDFLSLVGRQAKHSYILHDLEWDFQVLKCMCCEEVLRIGCWQNFKQIGEKVWCELWTFLLVPIRNLNFVNKNCDKYVCWWHGDKNEAKN